MSPPTKIEPIHPVDLVRQWRSAAKGFKEIGLAQAEVITRTCADQLETWIGHEGLHLMLCCDPAMVRVVHAGINFDADDEASAEALLQACAALQAGGES
jgi:aspartate aminotransferase-like enzyme